ncbi:MAG: hypothetical protein ABGX16_14855 [Pirellulales bacterium]
MTPAIMLAMDESTKWMLAPLVLPIFLWALWHKVQKLRRQENPIGFYRNLTEQLSVSLWAVARLWNMFSGLILLAMLVNAWQYGFDELRDIIVGKAQCTVDEASSNKRLSNFPHAERDSCSPYALPCQRAHRIPCWKNDRLLQ